MPIYMRQYIDLCRSCSMDISTVGNMLRLVIPSLQREAFKLRQAVESVPVVYLCRRALEEDAELLESAINAGLRRCRPQPTQQELFAA